MRHYIIPIFIPHYGCPHQCVFCDQQSITGVRQWYSEQEITAIIAEHLARLRPGRSVEIAFYGGSFTALPAAIQERLLKPAMAVLQQGKAAAIRVSTRPDAIDTVTIKRLQLYGVSTVELGVQSLDDYVLEKSERGHSAAEAIAAVALLKSFQIKCGVQLMPGLPGEDWRSLIHTATQAVALMPDFVRIYPTVVLAGTKLAAMFKSGTYQPLSLRAAIVRAAYLKLLFDRQHIPVIRLGLQASEALEAPGTIIAGPYHPAFGEMVSAFWFGNMVSRFLEELGPSPRGPLILRHHPRDHSKLRGIASANLTHWHQTYPGVAIRPIPDWSQQDEVEIEWQDIRYVVNQAMIFNC
ncbi:MAG: radical SAM protein [Negativicutes bacterium]|nr:radical SAM protein [Negativicutes bacterium]